VRIAIARYLSPIRVTVVAIPVTIEAPETQRRAKTMAKVIWKHASSDAWHCDQCGKIRDYKNLYINPKDTALTICSWCRR